ncbi:hypothetical protein I79_022913 [Cricetulus griseus]|uniref:Uncharacterized protein n=1 Tax=Cricetulus griseus TaxID=10029 RepID=G3IGJ6_CRIGR|nr:hypothetical protein I79_022913 [Cricetulus griseus]
MINIEFVPLTLLQEATVCLKHIGYITEKPTLCVPAPSMFIAELGSALCDEVCQGWYYTNI